MSDLKEKLKVYGVEEVSPDSEWETSEDELEAEAVPEVPKGKKSKANERSDSLEKDLPKREPHTQRGRS